MSNSPKAEIQITAESRTLGAKLREARAQFGRFGGALRKEVFGRALFDSGKASAHMVGQLGAAAVGRGLGFFEDQARGVLHFNDALLRFQIAARKTPEEAQEIGAAARHAAEETGLASETVLAGERAYVDLAGAENASAGSMRTLARTAQASGAAIGDMATVAYSLTNALKVRPEELEDVIGGLINQSKDGTIHFQNMAEEIIALAPKFARFGTLGREGAAELGAMVQVAGSGFKDAAEASTGIQGLFRGLQLHEKLFRKAGVATLYLGKDGAKHLRPLEDIVADISRSKLMKDPTMLLKDIGRGEGDAFLRLWIEQMGKYRELVEAAKVNGVVQKDLATVTASTSGRTAIAMERMKNAIAEAFTPERINAFVDAIEGLADKVGPLAEGIGKIGSGLGALYDAGKAIRGYLTPGDSRLAEVTPEDIELEAKAKGLTPQEAAKSLQAQRGRYLAAKRAIAGAIVDDKTTPESNRRAVAALISTQDATGEGARLAGAQYVAAAHLTPEVVQAIAKQVREETIDAEITAGRGRSTAPYDMVAAMTQALRAAAPEIGRSIAQSAGPTTVKADGKAIVDVHRGSSVHARRPGG